MLASACVQLWSTATSHIGYSENAPAAVYGHLARMDESADARILTAVLQSDRKRSAGPHTSWLATIKNELTFLNLSLEDAIKVIGNKQSYALKQCKPNNDDDDDYCNTVYVIVFRSPSYR